MSTAIIDRNDATSGTPATMFEAAASLLRSNIEAGHLLAGFVLQESALAERLGMSRATVKRAFSILEDEGLLTRFSGRGLVVAGGCGTPQRVDLRQVELDLEGLDDALGQPSWHRIYAEVERELSRSLIFGRYRVIEAMIAQEYDISRTVVRDVLGRLQERGLVQKTQTSRWIVEPLTAQRIKDKFELRQVLEVAALKSGRADQASLQHLLDEIRSLDPVERLSPARWFRLEGCFFEAAVMATPNRDLARFAELNRRALDASQLALFSLGLPPDLQTLREIATIIELLQTGPVSAAADLLTTHLGNAMARTIAQLKITAIIDPPTDLAPYLSPA
ncbi:GntR family transcriptional regulator [Thioclava sp. FTW29]|uniref:GntR family transcriptional regulator n=1 Tax=Thioclava litoralis TaxID=3076557 RepID=A0ABZ1E407_9RHOB|nr:GntR family transcriptional regulator [Thioclava sp. FTW29]